MVARPFVPRRSSGEGADGQFKVLTIVWLVKFASVALGASLGALSKRMVKSYRRPSASCSMYGKSFCGQEYKTVASASAGKAPVAVNGRPTFEAGKAPTAS